MGRILSSTRVTDGRALGFHSQVTRSSLSRDSPKFPTTILVVPRSSVSHPQKTTCPVALSTGGSSEGLHAALICRRDPSVLHTFGCMWKSQHRVYLSAQSSIARGIDVLAILLGDWVAIRTAR